MGHQVYEKMVYSFEKPMWHVLTEPSKVPMSAEAILDQKFNGGFEIFTRPITVLLNGQDVETGDFAIIRGQSKEDPKEIVLDYCTSRYNPLQPREVAQSFDTNVQEPAETMAFLKNGSEMFISWVMPKFEVRTGDEVEMYGIVRTGFDTLNGTRLFTSIYRPVCANTINLAENWANQNKDGKGKGAIWSGKGVNKNLLRDLGYWMAHVQGNAIREGQLLQSFFGKLADTPIKSDVEAHEILFQAFPPRNDVSEFYPKQLKEQKAEAIEDYNSSQAELRDMIYGLFAGAGTAITPDYWGMLNATSEYFCHYQPSKRPIANSVMFGARQQNTMQMVKTLAKRAS